MAEISDWATRRLVEMLWEVASSVANFSVPNCDTDLTGCVKQTVMEHKRMGLLTIPVSATLIEEPHLRCVISSLAVRALGD